MKLKVDGGGELLVEHEKLHTVCDTGYFCITYSEGIWVDYLNNHRTLATLVSRDHLQATNCYGWSRLITRALTSTSTTYGTLQRALENKSTNGWAFLVSAENALKGFLVPVAFFSSRHGQTYVCRAMPCRPAVPPASGPRTRCGIT